EIIKKLIQRKIEKEDLMIKTQLKKSLSEYKAISPHVIAARKMNENKIPISYGNIVEYYIAESKEKKALVRDRVKLPDEKGEYDIEYYLKHQILPAVENIFQVFGVNTEELMERKKQKKLSEF
ncbi:MAG: DNA polymerase domain-containing protein, partial [Nanoarchaeota archaeon]